VKAVRAEKLPTSSIVFGEKSMAFWSRIFET
jgi:hypothetical protein